MASVDQDGELNDLGTTEIHDGIKRRADGAARVENVVHKNDAFAVDVERDVGRMDFRGERS